MELKTLVVKICKDKHISQRQLAQLMGISYIGLRTNLAPGRDPKLSTILRFADALGVPPAEFTTMLLDPEGAEERCASQKVAEKVIDKVQNIEPPKFNNALECPYCGKLFLLAAAKLPAIFNHIK